MRCASGGPASMPRAPPETSVNDFPVRVFTQDWHPADHTSFANSIRLAVKRMLPKTTLGKQMLNKLKVYEGSEHPHSAQKPQPLELRA